MTVNRVVQVDNIIARRTGEEVVLIKDDGTATHVLNKTAGAVWELCDGEHSFDQITARLCERFDVSFDEARRDIEEVIDVLIGVGVLKRLEKEAMDKGEDRTD